MSKGVIYLGLPFLILTVLFIRKSNYFATPQQVRSAQLAQANQAWDDKVKDAVNKWNQQPASPLGTNFSALIHATPIEILDEAVVSEEVKGKLHEVVVAFLDCYSGTDFSRFKSFRLRYPYSVGDRYVDLATKLDNNASQMTDEELLQLLWRSKNGTNRISHVAWEKTRLHVCNGANGDDPILRFAHSSDLPAVEKAPGFVAKPAVITRRDQIIVQPTPAQIRAKGGPLLYAHAGLMVRFNGSIAMPLHLIFYWSEVHHDWIPWQFARLMDDGYDTVF